MRFCLTGIAFKWVGPDWDEISAEAKDLIKLMLEKDPKKRISAKDALQHPWIQGKAPKKPLGKKLFENMKNFSVIIEIWRIFLWAS